GRAGVEQRGGGDGGARGVGERRRLAPATAEIAAYQNLAAAAIGVARGYGAAHFDVATVGGENHAAGFPLHPGGTHDAALVDREIVDAATGGFQLHLSGLDRAGVFHAGFAGRGRQGKFHDDRGIVGRRGVDFVAGGEDRRALRGVDLARIRHAL